MVVCWLYHFDQTQIHKFVQQLATWSSWCNLDELSASIAEMVEPQDEAAVLEIVNKYDENLKHNLMSIAEARELQGIEKGIEKGMVQGLEKVARFMLQAQEPINKIMSYTGLTREAIEKLQAEG